jgi:RsiW-degrading membrane proteinase PrsW (M82 family)
MNVLLALIPVVVFLVLLILMDSFKLIRKTSVGICILWGIICSFLAYLINPALFDLIGLTNGDFTRYISPVVEETLKMLIVIVLISSNRVGFMIDGAIYGFAVGTGFALVENIYFLHQLESSNLLLWTIRGFGTAIMHGGSTSVLAIVMMQTYDKQKPISWFFLYGWIAAVVIHSFFNHFVLPPFATMVFTLTIISFTELIIFRFSERSLRKWLELEFDSEVKLLMMIRKGKFAQTHSGGYLHTIKDRFSQLVVFDMLAYISLYLELSIKVKSMLMLREAGMPVTRDPEINAKLQELRALERNIGVTGLIAIKPVLRTSRKDLWKWSTLK